MQPAFGYKRAGQKRERGSTFWGEKEERENRESLVGFAPSVHKGKERICFSWQLRDLKGKRERVSCSGREGISKVSFGWDLCDLKGRKEKVFGSFLVGKKGSVERH